MSELPPGKEPTVSEQLETLTAMMVVQAQWLIETRAEIAALSSVVLALGKDGAQELGKAHRDIFVNEVREGHNRFARELKKLTGVEPTENKQEVP